jgi:WD40 repeat protein
MQYVAIVKSHTSSVKGVTTLDSNCNIFATSGRDGSILIFDTRMTAVLDETVGHSIHKPVNAIHNAHIPLEVIKGLKSSKKKMEQVIQDSYD